MKLTKLQRYTAYCILLAEAEIKLEHGYYNDGLCFLIRHLNVTDDFTHTFGNRNEKDLDIRYDLPELKKILDRESDLWFMDEHYAFEENKEGWEQRISALKACIEETHP